MRRGWSLRRREGGEGGLRRNDSTRSLAAPVREEEEGGLAGCSRKEELGSLVSLRRTVSRRVRATFTRHTAGQRGDRDSWFPYTAVCQVHACQIEFKTNVHFNI